MSSNKLSVGAQLIEAGARSASIMCRIVELSITFDESGEWVEDHARSAAHWIAKHLGVEVCTAREWIRIGKKLRELPVLAEAFRNQDLSYSKIRTLSRFAEADNESELIALGVDVPAGRLGEALARWSLKNQDQETIRQRQHRSRSLTVRVDPDGMGSVSLRLEPLQLGIFTAAVDGHMVQHKHASADAYPSFAQQRADALMTLISGKGKEVRTELVLHVRGDGCTLDNGIPLANSVIERVAPRSFLRALIHDAEGRPINASSAQRHPTLRQKRVVKEKYKECVDCGSTEALQYDHQPEWNTTRNTVVDELVIRCVECHRHRHKRAG